MKALYSKFSTFFKYFIIIIIIIAAFFLYKNFANNTKQIENAIAKKQDVISTIASTGRVTSDTIVSLKSQIPNLIKSSGFKEGDKFKSGDILVELDSSNETKAYEQAELNLKNASIRLDTINNKDIPDAKEAVFQANAAYEKSKNDYDRIKSLNSSGSETASNLEYAKYNLDLAQSKLKSAKTDLDSISKGGVSYNDALNNIELSQVAVDSAKISLDKTKIIAPFNGTILKKSFTEGELSSVGKELFLIAKDEELQVLATVDEKYISKLSLKQKVKIRPQAYESNVVEGYIKRIAPSVDNSAGTIEITIKIDNPPAYFTRDMTTNIEIVTDTLNSVIVLDKKFIGGQNGHTVLVLKNEIVEAVEVELGNDLGDRAVIVKGINEGDIVLLKDSYKTGTHLSLNKVKG